MSLRYHSAVSSVSPHRVKQILTGSFGELLLQPDTGGKCAPHFHATYAIGVARSGGGTIHALDRVWTHRARMLVVTNPYDTHWGRPARSGLDYVLLNPATSWIEMLPALAERSSARWFDRAVYDDVQLADAFTAAADHLAETGDAIPLRDAVNALFERYAVVGDAESARVRGSPFPEPNSDRPISDLAVQAGLSRAHFSRAYRRSTGLSPLDHRRQLRVLAARALIETGASLADAAATAGFADQAHMSRQFRQILGATPGTFRPVR